MLFCCIQGTHFHGRPSDVSKFCLLNSLGVHLVTYQKTSSSSQLNNHCLSFCVHQTFSSGFPLWVIFAVDSVWATVICCLFSPHIIYSLLLSTRLLGIVLPGQTHTNFITVWIWAHMAGEYYFASLLPRLSVYNTQLGHMHTKFITDGSKFSIFDWLFGTDEVYEKWRKKQLWYCILTG